MDLRKISCFCLFFLMMLSSRAQEVITGNIYTANDSTALRGVSVYFDGTSLGTTTNKEGFFRIDNIAGNKTPLIIRYMGYESLVVTNIPEGTQKLPPFFLKVKSEELGEVIIEPDPWSREKKLAIFRREFLGRTPEADRCRIKNEEVLQLYYSPSTETLTAEATEPLLIVNRFLGYEVEYTLVSFKAEFFTGTTGFRSTELVYYEGYSFFRELRNRVRKRFLRNREKTYSGSPVHFMRSLAGRELESNGFRIFHESLEVPPYKYFDLKNSGELVEVEMLTEKLDILYKKKEQSAIHSGASFVIQRFGNHTPPNRVSFSGIMSTKRIAHLLPLDYNLEN